MKMLTMNGKKRARMKGGDRRLTRVQAAELSQWVRTDGPPRKRQRTAALQNLAAVGGRPESRQRLGVRQSSAAFPLPVRS